ncbi:MAG TPA: hypothetical protein VHO69_15485 [Phototrophicaceae bacterium]|nr:hypothetical protein [Phototrophicaceae bacterium]
MWRNRKTTLAALGSVIVVWLLLNGRFPTDDEYLRRYNLSAAGIQTAYTGLLVGLALLTILEPVIRPVLRRTIPAVLVIAAAGLTAFFSFQLALPVPEKRLFDLPFSLWLVMAHLNLLAVLAVVLVTERPLAPPERRLTRSAVGFLALLGVLTATLYLASLGIFARIDTPDEPWVGSVATTFAETGHLTSTFFTSVFGDPDVAFPRVYYLFMGLVVRAVGNSQLETLRLTPLLWGLITVGVLVWGLRRPGTTTLEWLAAVVTLLGLSTFLRTTHNLRMDIPLALYAACALWGLLRFFDAPIGRKRWAVFLGAALFIGMQGVAPVALAFGIAIGLMLLLEAPRQLKTNWPPIALYAGVSALAIIAYYVVQFLPDIPRSLETYRQFVTYYSGKTGLFSLDFPFPVLLTMVRFGQALSPLELIFSLAAVGLLLWHGSRTDRLIVGVMVITMAIVFLVLNLSYSYFVIFAPLIAYALSRLLRWRVAVIAGVFVLIPALVTVPIHDLTRAMQDDHNRQLLANDQVMVTIIPENVTVVADDRLWFTLHSHRQFIGWNGANALATFQRLTWDEAWGYMDVDYIICSTEFRTRCDVLMGNLDFRSPVEVTTPQETYFVFQRRS